MSKKRTNGHTAAPAGINKQFAKPCPYCGGAVVGAVTTTPGGGATFGLSHGATPCPMVDAIRDEVQRDGDFDPTVLLRASGLT